MLCWQHASEHGVDSVCLAAISRVEKKSLPPFRLFRARFTALELTPEALKS